MYHVIRSSNENLEKLDQLINEELPGTFIRPFMTTHRRSRDKSQRRPVPVRVLMYPGYAFIEPRSNLLLESYRTRITHHYLRNPQTNFPLEVPDEQLQYALTVQRRSLSVGTPLPANTRVRFIDGALGGRCGAIQSCKGHHAVVWLDGGTFPVTALIVDLEPIA